METTTEWRDHLESAHDLVAKAGQTADEESPCTERKQRAGLIHQAISELAVAAEKLEEMY